MLNKRVVLLLPFIPFLGLTGCSTTLGLGESSSYTCKAPEGVSCESVSGTYANAIAGNLPGQKKRGALPTPVQLIEGSSEFYAVPGNQYLAPPPTVLSGKPLLSEQETMRVTLFPWRDQSNVLHDKSYMYMIVKESEWNMEHTEERLNQPSFGTFKLGTK